MLAILRRVVGAGVSHLDTAHFYGACNDRARIFTIFEGTPEIQHMLIGRAVTGLDVR